MNSWEFLLQWLENLVKTDTYLIYQLLFWIGVLVLVMVYYFIEKIKHELRVQAVHRAMENGKITEELGKEILGE